MKRALLILLVLGLTSCELCPAQTVCASGCMQENCSNDPAGNPAASRTVGDEDFSVCFFPEDPRCPTTTVEIQRAETGATVVLPPGDATLALNGTLLFEPDALPAANPDRTINLVTIRARACGTAPTCLTPCGAWSSGVVYLFHAVLRSLPAVPDGRGGTTNPGCEERPSPSAPYRLSERYPPCS